MYIDEGTNKPFKIKIKYLFRINDDIEAKQTIQMFKY